MQAKVEGDVNTLLLLPSIRVLSCPSVSDVCQRSVSKHSNCSNPNETTAELAAPRPRPQNWLPRGRHHRHFPVFPPLEARYLFLVAPTGPPHILYIRFTSSGGILPVCTGSVEPVPNFFWFGELGKLPRTQPHLPEYRHCHSP